MWPIFMEIPLYIIPWSWDTSLQSLVFYGMDAMSIFPMIPQTHFLFLTWWSGLVPTRQLFRNTLDSEEIFWLDRAGFTPYSLARLWLNDQFEGEVFYLANFQPCLQVIIRPYHITSVSYSYHIRIIFIPHYITLNHIILIIRGHKKLFGFDKIHRINYLNRLGGPSWYLFSKACL